ncbi:unnamed protein product, partial [Phaeothamnion confervicola]
TLRPSWRKARSKGFRSIRDPAPRTACVPSHRHGHAQQQRGAPHRRRHRIQHEIDSRFTSARQTRFQEIGQDAREQEESIAAQEGRDWDFRVDGSLRIQRGSDAVAGRGGGIWLGRRKTGRDVIG